MSSGTAWRSAGSGRSSRPPGRRGCTSSSRSPPARPSTTLREFAHGIGKAVARDTPHVVSEFTQSREKGTVFVDYLQNAPGKTMVAPYSLRATPGATVSAPLRWEELRHGVRPEDYTVQDRALENGDPWRDLFEDRQRIP